LCFVFSEERRQRRRKKAKKKKEDKEEERRQRGQQLRHYGTGGGLNLLPLSMWRDSWTMK